MDKETEKLLERVGYYKAKRKYGSGNPNKFPDLKIDNHRQKYPSQLKFDKPLMKKFLHPDAKQFPIGLSHKQGYQLITKFDDLKDMGGKKT